MVVAIADIALGHNIGQAIYSKNLSQGADENSADNFSMVTVNLSSDYSGTAAKGDWVEVHVEVQHVGRSLAYANAYLIADSQKIARVNGIFNLKFRNQ